jgi:hypothetical protein
LLLLLALERGQWLDRDRIAALLWPTHALPEARRNLRKVVFRARAVPGAQALESTDHALRWSVATDLQAFDDACAAAMPSRPGPGAAARRCEGVDDPANGALGRGPGGRARPHRAGLGGGRAEELRKRRPEAPRRRRRRRILEVDPLDETAMAALLQAERELGHEAEAQAALPSLRHAAGAKSSASSHRAHCATWCTARRAAGGAGTPKPRQRCFVGRSVSRSAKRRRC